MTTKRIVFQNVNLNFPLYSAGAMSLRKSLASLTTGGLILRDKTKKPYVQALDNININLTSGDRVALIGHNGAGKSCLLKLMAGVYTQTSGQINISGNVAALLNLSLGLEPEATGYENIRIRGLIMGLSRKAINRLIPEIEAFSELGEYLSMPIKTYSSGMQLRLAFAISTSVNSEILLLDEVIGVGDAHFKEKTEARLKEVMNKAEIIVLASHDDAIIKDVCTQAITLNHGRIIRQGDVQSALQEYQTLKTELVTS